MFTAGTKNYANSILDILDPTGELIQHRLFRDSWIEVKADGSSLFVKDLRIFEGRSLDDIFIVDNAVFSFAYQIDNGIPILPFREDKDDTEFLHLINIMRDISEENDWRDFIRKSFKISEIMKTDINSYVHHYEISDSDDENFDEDNWLNILAAWQKSLNWGMQKSVSDSSTINRKKKKRVSLKKMKKNPSLYVQSSDNNLLQSGSVMLSQKQISSENKLLLLDEVSNLYSSTNSISEFDDEYNDLFESMKVWKHENW